jgi:hypothetical protein
MTIRVQGFQAPKTGSSPEECQDAVGWDEINAVYAVADGVSDSAFQRIWARLLVDSFVVKARSLENFSQDWLASWLETEQKEWHSQVNWETIPWHGRLKAQQTGGEATFLGIRLLPAKGAWTGVAIGDCNLFRFDSDHVFIESVPIKQSADFSNATQAFSSIRNYRDTTFSQVKFIQGNYKPGDTLVLATDAMACWMLKMLEERLDPLKEIPASNEASVFDQWVSVQRNHGKIKNDDTSLLLIQAKPVKSSVAPGPVQPGYPTNQIGQLRTAQPQPQVAGSLRIPISISLILCLVFTIVGFWLGSTWQNSLNNRQIESEVQIPLYEVVRSMNQNWSPAVIGIEKEILITIVQAGPETETAQLACKLIPKEKICLPGSSQ